MANVFSDAPVGISVEAGNPTHYVDWGAIFAGVFISLAISSVFLAFGSAIGLSVTSFNPSTSAPVIGVVIAAGLWLLWVQISSFIGGAYVAGRMEWSMHRAQLVRRRYRGLEPRLLENNR